MIVIDMFFLVLFVYWNLFCTIANLRIKCVTETKNVSVLFYKNLKSSFSTWLTHLPLRFLYILGWSGPWCAAPGIPSSAIPDFDHYIGKWIKIQMYVQLLKYLCSDFWCDSTQKTSTLLYRSVLRWLASADRELNLPIQQVFLNRTVSFVILQSRFGKLSDLKNSATADAEPETSLPSGSIRKALWQSSAGKLK